jgi:histidinol dehydrogenase
LRKALQIAEKNIRQFQEWQKPAMDVQATISLGSWCGRWIRRIMAAGSLGFNLLMAVIPAQVAGVKDTE